MGRNKIEMDFREKLNQREIAPSSNAWDRLDAMLAVAEENKSKPKYSWMHIAASLLGFLFIGIMFLTQTEEAIDVRRNEVVIETTSNTQSSELPPVENITKEVGSETESIAFTNKETKYNRSNHTTASASHQVTKKYVTENQLINQGQISQSIINQKTEQQITPADVDELLATVHPLEIVVANQSVKVNANALLSQVDGELDLSFREKVIKNFKAAKVVVSNRNIKE